MEAKEVQDTMEALADTMEAQEDLVALEGLKVLDSLDYPAVYL